VPHRHKSKFEFLDHTADIKIKAYGKDMEELFENLALAVTTYMSKGKKILSSKKKIIKIKAQDSDALLYKFIDEILFLVDAKNFVISKTKLKIKDNQLTAEFLGDDVKNYHLDHVKAPTYAEMYIKKTPSGFEAQLVLDV